MSYLITLFVLFYTTWLFYLAVMNLKRARDNVGLTLPVRILGYPILFIGLLLDFLLNMTLCTILFLELPKETLVTGRLKRHIKSTGWRSKLAGWLCSNFLDTFDPSGCHCN